MHTSGEAELTNLSSADVACARGHRNSRQRSVVCSAVAAIGSRGVGRRCGPDSCQLCPVKQKTDRRDAGHILKLLIEGRFPRIWVPRRADARPSAVAGSSPRSWSRYVRVSKTNCSISCSTKACRRSRSSGAQKDVLHSRPLSLDPWADRRRHDLLHLLGILDVQLGQLDAAVKQVASQYPDVQLLF